MDMTNPEPFDYERQKLYPHPYAVLIAYFIGAVVILVGWCMFGDSRQGTIIGFSLWVFYCVPCGFFLFETGPAQRAASCNEWKLRYLNLGDPEFSAAVLLDKKRALLKEIQHDSQMSIREKFFEKIIRAANFIGGFIRLVK